MPGPGCASNLASVANLWDVPKWRLFENLFPNIGSVIEAARCDFLSMYDPGPRLAGVLSSILASLGDYLMGGDLD